MQFIRHKWAQFVKQFFLINDSPHKVSAGAALGVFLGIIPGEGLGTTLILASLLKWNRLAATAGVLATNMWLSVLLLPPSAYVGAFIFDVDYQELIDNFQMTYHLGFKYFLSKTIFLDLLLPLIIGFIIIAGLAAALVYGSLYYLLKNKKLEFD